MNQKEGKIEKFIVGWNSLNSEKDRNIVFKGKMAFYKAMFSVNVFKAR